MARTTKNILIEDFYNANPTSMNVAPWRYLETIVAGKKVVMLGDMRESLVGYLSPSTVLSFRRAIEYESSKESFEWEMNSKKALLRKRKLLARFNCSVLLTS